MKFTVEISIGDDQMQTYGDVRDALQRLVTALRHAEDVTPAAKDGIGYIGGANGTVVGKWGVIETDHPAELLRRALAALNRAPCFRIPSLNTNSYGIAAEIDDYFHQMALTETKLKN
jgi:hypothetical protein